MTKIAFAINLHRCIGCRTCAVSCKMENKVADGIQRMHVLNDAGTTVLDTPSGVYPNVSFTWMPVPCQHCDDAPCVSVCPTGATVKQENGIVTVDKATCIGCETCAKACPYDARTLDVEAGVIDKCELCIHRLEGGLTTTMCQMCCPNRAIVVGDLDDPESEVAKIVANNETERFLSEEGTEPNVYYWWSVKR